jgi:hypothetical protein
MDPSHVSFVRMGCRIAFVACVLLAPLRTWAQAAPPQSRIVDKVDESVLVSLRGNTHPLAQRQFDRGAAPADLPMARMLLVLKRGAAQEAALEKLLDDQQDQSSPSYHQWLTPDQFGQQFGPSDQDVPAVAAWLRAHGFQIGMIGRGRTVIEFSGTAAQVLQAFHTEIHKYTVNGEDHWANASDPQIPAALAPVIVGVASLHNFPKLPQYRIAGKFSRDNASGRVQPLAKADFTTVDSSICNLSGTGECYFVGPYDFAKIYNVLPLWTSSPAIDGTGQSIAIVSQSNINIQDVRDFRTLFGLPPNDPQIFLNGPDPGLVQGPETEALLDVELAGGVAKAATIKLVVSQATNSTQGSDLAGLYAVENSLASTVSESYGDCELFLGTAGNTFESMIRQQAAAQGITYINSAGDEGSARCDPFMGNAPAPATHGLTVSGLASTPYGVAVGGTDFLNFGANYTFKTPSPYWNTSNGSNQVSAKGYIPETVWNSNCTSPAYIAVGAGTSAEASCNNPNASGAVQTVAGGGGKSSCITSDGATPSTCSGGYPKPSWQSAPGVPADGVRDIPDLSLFSSPGFMDSAYIVCEADVLPTPVSCSLNTPFTTFLGIGGTSAAAPSFAGIMALVDQYTHSSGQGNANYVLYRLASSSLQTSNSCGASSNPSSQCIFYDVTAGSNTVPCLSATYDCVTSTSGDSYGVLSGYDAGTGYDLATGLGSINAYNMVHAWSMPATQSHVTLSLSPTTITHGQSVNYSITVTPNSATGDVSLIGSPTGTGSDGVAFLTLQNGIASGTTRALPGGTSYAVKAHYPGDTNNAPSDSSPVTVTVTPEPSKPVIWISAQTNPVVTTNPSAVSYGTQITGIVGVGNAQATAAIPPQPVCTLLACPTGAVTVSDSFNGGSPVSVGPPTGLPLDITGETQNFSLPLLAGGQYQISASYPGDNSYQAGTGTYALTVLPAFVFMSFNTFLPPPVLLGTSLTLSVTVSSFVVSGTGLAAPTGTITFTDGGAPIPGTVTYTSQSGAGINGSLTASIPYTFSAGGGHQIVASYNGDSNYSANSTTMSVWVVYPTTMTESLSAMTINAGQSVTVTATAKSSAKSPAMTGTFVFGGNPLFNPVGPVVPTLSTDAGGDQVLTATASVTPLTYSSQLILVDYSGDSNFEAQHGNITLTVNPPGFTMSTSVPSMTITAGQSGIATVTATPQTTLSSSVSLTCNLFPIVGETCSFSPTSQLNLNNGTATSASATISIATVAASASPTTSFGGPRLAQTKDTPPAGGWLFVLVDALAVLILSLWSGQKHKRLAACVGMICMLLLAIGCGSSGGNGGGGPVPTTLTLTTSAVKVPSGSMVTMTATVHSTQSPTGTVTLGEPGLQLASGTVINGTATFQFPNLPVGTHVISAAYSGDANNQGSQTNGSISEVITGTVPITISGVSGTLTNNATMSVTIQ